ncbi:MAG: cytochrome P450 [Candidatus Binatus sp.]|uniref:cytochrome P450 n=1 Tax=Candidatus Binatus sp. TaxID=2811406 RepID=UPI003C778627
MSETTAPGASQNFYFNPWDENFRANPYPHYKPLLAGPPRIIDLFGPVAMVTRYADVMAVLRDHAHFSSERPRDPSEPPNEGPFAGARTMLFSDPPTHTRLRRLVSRDFTPRRIRELEPRVREIAKNLIDHAQRKGELEVMSGFANALPVMVIAEMLGVPPDHYEQFKHWSDTVVSGDNTLPGTPLPAEFHAAIKALRSYFAEEIDRRRKHPGADLISALVAAHDDAEAMNADELLAFVLLLLLAGNETTTNLIGNGMLALGRNPAQMNLLRQRPELMARAIEEILRYDGPVQSTVRFTKEDINLGGTKLPANQGCFIILAAANRDPAQFEDPDRFDITREPRDHVAFGEGIHFCIGAPLARMEGAIAIGAMLERFGRLRLKDPAMKPAYKGSYFLRGLESLPVAID